MNTAKHYARRARRRAAFTLLELVVVLVILVALAGLLLPLFGGLAFQSATNATMENLRRLQDLIINRYVPDTKGAVFSNSIKNSLGAVGDGTTSDGYPRYGSANLPPQFICISLPPPGLQQYNPATLFGWNGPYSLTGQGTYPGMDSSTAATRRFLPAGGTSSAFGSQGDPTPLDAWGNPIVIVPINDATHGQYYYALLSAGPTGVLGTVVADYGKSTPTGVLATDALPATIVSNSASDGNLDNASYGPILTFSSAESYQYWLPLK